MFFNLPSRIKIDTPIGTYNPDWAVYLEKDDMQGLYFILENKGNVSKRDLRSHERLKIHCGEEHFKALGDEIGLHIAKNWVVQEILCKAPTSGKIEITDVGGFKLWQEKTTGN